MSHGLNWIAGGAIILFFTHCGFQSYQQWQAERQMKPISTEEAAN
jgi:hypothetical protein